MNIKYLWILAIAVVLLPSVVIAQAPLPAETLSVEQVVRDVVRNNDRVKAAAFMEEAARRQIGPAGAWDDPMLMLGVQNLPPSFRSDEEMMTMKMVGLSQKVPYAGQKGLQAKAKRAEADAAHEDRRDIIVDLVSAARTAYAELYYHRQLIDDLERQRDLYEQVVASTRSRVMANLAGLDDMSAAQAALWRSEAEILSHYNDAYTAYLRLSGLRGVTAADSLPAVASPLRDASLPSAQAWIDSAQLAYAPLRRLSRQAESYAFSARAADRMSWPMLELSGSYGIREDLKLPNGEIEKQDNMISLFATFSLPFFAGRQQRNMARSMTAMRRERELEASQLRRDVEASLATLHQRARRSAESIRLHRRQIIPADEEAFKSGLNSYTAGRMSLPDVLTYAVSVYRDRVTASQLELEHERTLIEAGRYVTDADQFLQNEEIR